MPSQPEVPTIETDRLRLRGHRPDDLATCAGMWADPTVTRYIGGRPFSEEEVWARMLRYAGHWAWLGFGYWLIEEKSSGHFVGEVGFANYKREIDSPIQNMPELGWALATAMSGKGYATESTSTAIAWFDSHFPAVSTTCLIAPENTASIRVANKCHYRELERTTYRGLPVILFVRS